MQDTYYGKGWMKYAKLSAASATVDNKIRRFLDPTRPDDVIQNGVYYSSVQTAGFWNV